jgi:hypothetical protein
MWIANVSFLLLVPITLKNCHSLKTDFRCCLFGSKSECDAQRREVPVLSEQENCSEEKSNE